MLLGDEDARMLLSLKDIDTVAQWFDRGLPMLLLKIISMLNDTSNCVILESFRFMKQLIGPKSLTLA